MSNTLRWVGTLFIVLVSFIGYGQCAVSTFPYLEDFDGTSWGVSSTFDPCWPKSSGTPTWTVDNNGTTSSFTGPDGDKTGGNYLYLEATSGATGAIAYVETPYFDLTGLSNPVISFYYHRYGVNMGDMFIEASLDSGVTWCEVYRISGETHFGHSDPWLPDSANLTAVKSAYTKLRFASQKGADYRGDNAIDSVAVYNSAVAVCTAPVCLNMTAAGSTTIDFDWTSGNANFTYEYGAPGFAPGTGAAIGTGSASMTMAQLTGLTPATQYDIYVRSDCGAPLGASDWSQALSVITTCVLVNTFPYTENFDGGTWVPTTTYDPCWAFGSTSSFDWRVNSGGTGTGSTGPSSDASGSGQYIYVESSSSGGEPTAQLPEMDLTSLTAPELAFDFHMYGSDMGNLYVEGSLDTGATWTVLDSIVGQQQSSSADSWLPYAVDLTSVSSAYTLVRFRMVRGSGGLGDASLDEVVVHEAPPCPTPTNFMSFNVGSTTAQVSFDAQTGATRSVEWGPQGFTPGTGMLASSTTDTVDLTGLPDGTCLDLYIQTDCSSNGNGISAVSGPFTICTAYIPDWLENFDGGFPPSDFLQAVGPLNGGAIGYGTSNWFQSAYGNAGGGSISARFNIYATFQPDHWMVTPAIDLGTGNTYNFEYDVAWTEYFSTADAVIGVDDTVHVVISTDNGATWSRSNILMSYHQGNPVEAVGKHEVIQLSGYSGIVRFGFIETSTVSNADTDFFIDNIEVRTPPACLEPFAFSTITVEPDSVYFTFTADTAAAGYNIEWGPCGFGQGTGMTGTITNDSAGIGGLATATCYDLYIQTDCGSGQSIWSGPFQFFSACDTLPIPWNEGFESLTIPNYPACWSSASQGSFYLNTETGASGSNPGPRSGSNYLRHRYSFNNEWWSFTPEFNLSGSQSYEISFWYQTEGTTAFDEVTLAFGSGQTPSDMIYTIATETGVQSAGYTQYVATFIPVTSGRYYIGLKTRTTGFSGAMNIDDFQLRLDPNPCPDPSSLTATIVSAFEVDLAWGGIPAHTTYDVEWGPTGFVVGTGVGYQYYGLTNATLNLDTLSENTCYDFYVRADCGSGAGNWVGPYTWCTPCTSSPLPYLEDFDVWPLNCVDPAAGDQAWVNNGGWAEASFWSFNDANFIMNMRNVDITVDARVKFTWSHSYNATYPEDAMTIRARVLGTTAWDTLWTRSGAAFESNDGAGNTTRGSGAIAVLQLDPATYTGNEVEFQLFAASDYGPDVFVNDWIVEALPSCPEPYTLDFLAGSETTTSGEIYYTPGGASNFNISYAIAGTVTNPSSGTIVNATNDTAVVSGLMPATTYEVWVRDSCAVGDVSTWTGPITFTTLCVPFNTTYIQDFSSWPPVCWDVEAGAQPWVSFAGWAQANYFSFNNTAFVMNSPQIILSDTSEMSFKWSHQYNTGYPLDAMTVRVRQVGTAVWDTVWFREGTTFDSQDGAGLFNPGSGVQEFVSIPGYGAGDTIQVQVYAWSDWGPYAYVDDISIYDRPGCPAPGNFTFLNSTSTTADLAWDAGSVGSSSWAVEVGPPGFQPGMGTTYTVFNDTATISGLTGNTGYCAFLTEICPGGADSSSTIGPICFQTACVPYGIPYSESFDVAPISSCFFNYNTANSTSANAFWKMTDISWGNYGAAGIVDHTGNGGFAVGVDASSPYDPSMDSVLLLSPYIDITGHSGLELKFWLFSDASAYTYPNNILTVAAWTNSGWSNIYTYSGDSSAWVEAVIPLGGLGLADTTRFMFGIDKTASAYFYNDIMIDDISVETPPTCPTVGAVSFTNLTQTGSDASWDTTFSPQTYQIEYGPGGFTPGTGTQVSVPTNSYTFNMLPLNNLAYEMYIRPICSGNDTGYWSGPTMIEKAIISCDDFEAYSPGLADVQSVFIQGWNGDGGDAEIASYGGSNALHIYDSGPDGFSDVVMEFDSIVSGTSVLSFDFQLATGAGGYYNILHNYTGPLNVWAIEVYMDANGTATVNQGTNGTGVIGTYTFNTTGWNTLEHHIDLDNDTAWIVVNGNVTTVGWQFSLGSLNQADRFNAVNFYSAANIGQTPDYYIDNFCVCPSPGSVMATNVTCTTIELDWSSLEPTSTIEYGASGFTPGTGTVVQTAAPYTISNLTANTDYDIWIGDECNGDTLYSGPMTITTANGPLPTLNPSATENTVTSTSATWDFDAGSANADSVYWNFGGTNQSGETVTQSFGANGAESVIVTAFNDCGSVTDTVTFLVEHISIMETALARSLNVYPNPTSGVISIEFALIQDEEVTLSVVNGLGQKVIDENLGKLNSYNGTVDLSALPKGVYILRVSSGSSVVNQRVTLQ